MADDHDLTPDNGKSPPFAQLEPKLHSVGQGEGYSGQEYGSTGQKEWRDLERVLDISPDGVVRGACAPGGEIDPDKSGTAIAPNQDAKPDHRSR